MVVKAYRNAMRAAWKFGPFDGQSASVRPPRHHRTPVRGTIYMPISSAFPGLHRYEHSLFLGGPRIVSGRQSPRDRGDIGQAFDLPCGLDRAAVADGPIHFRTRPRMLVKIDVGSFGRQDCTIVRARPLSPTPVAHIVLVCHVLRRTMTSSSTGISERLLGHSFARVGPAVPLETVSL